MKKKLRKELTEWAVILTVLAVLVTTGVGAKVASFLQRGILQTGLMQPDILDNGELQDAAYSFMLTDTNGNSVSFDEFRGKTVFINFWATWCPPCIAEMPDINELYEDIGAEKDIRFVMISMDKDPNKAVDYVREEEFGFPVYFLKTRLPGVYDTKSIPTTYVISPEGKIVAERHGMASYNSRSFKDFLIGL